MALVRYASISWSFFAIGQPYLSGVWLGVDLRTNAKNIGKNTCIKKRVNYMLKFF